MFDEDYCPRDSPDLWKESLDCQDDAETQYVNDTLANNLDDETEGEKDSDETLDDAIDDRNSTMDSDDDTIKNLITDSRTTTEYMIKSINTSPSSSKIQQKIPVPTVCETDSQRPGSSNILTQENNDFRFNSSQCKSSRNRARNSIIISDNSESDASQSESDTHAGRRVFNTVKSVTSSLKKKANIDSDSDSSDINDDNSNKAPISSAKTADRSSLSLKDKENLKYTNADSNSDDDMFSEEFPSAERNDKPLLSPENIKNLENNNVHLDDEVKNWLKKNNREELWRQQHNFRMKVYTYWEQQCMLYYLINTNSVSKWNLSKTWKKMKEEYKYLPQRSVKSLVHHFSRILQFELHRFNVPDKIVEIIKNTRNNKHE